MAESWSVERQRKLKSCLFLAALIVLAALLAALGPPALQRTVTEAIIKLVVVLGMFIFVGNSGVLSFGHIAFMAIAGYSSAIMTIPPVKKAVLLKLPPVLEALQLPVAVAAVIAAAATGLFALIVGIRNAKLEKIPYVLVVGDDDVAAGTVGVNPRGGDVERGVQLGRFVDQFFQEIADAESAALDA